MTKKYGPVIAPNRIALLHLTYDKDTGENPEVEVVRDDD